MKERFMFTKGPVILLISLVLVAIMAIYLMPIPRTEPPKTAEPGGPSLRSLAEARGFLIGAAVSASQLTGELLYGEALKCQFNIVTTENAMKFEPIHPRRDYYAFEDADAIVNFARNNSMKVRGHTLVWHRQLPSWINSGRFEHDEWIAILRDHISTVVKRYRGQVYAWDVVNEAIGDDGALRDTIWLRSIGPEYIDLAFRRAHEADPEARLFYNDYGAEGLGKKSDAVYELAKSLLQRGVPIHGVGLQMHISLESSPSPEDVAQNINRLAALGLEVQITEMDVRIRLPATRESLLEQAKKYEAMLKVCLSSRNCTAFVMWDFTDKYSWIPSFAPGYGSALILDEAYRPKPAYDALLNVLANASR